MVSICDFPSLFPTFCTFPHTLQETWPTLLHEAHRTGALVLFGDEASFAQWGTLSDTWAPVGHQPTVPTTGKRKAYNVFGLIEYVSGQVFYQGHTGRFTSESYQAFLQQVLQATSQPLILIQDGARYHTSRAMQTFFAEHRDHLTVHQLPSYSPDDHPIECLWKNTKRRATHNRYVPMFDCLTQSVEDALAFFAEHPEDVRQLMGHYCDEMAALPTAAYVSKTLSEHL